MDHICRLCLCTSPNLKHKLYGNEEMLRKISSCLKVEIFNNELLPDQVCTDCIDKTDQFFDFQKKVNENQYLLKSHWELGAESLENFYSSLKVDVKEEKDSVDKYEEDILAESCNESGLEKDNEIKSETLVFVPETTYSSDENVTLSSIQKSSKKRKKQKTQGHTAKVRKKKVAQKENLAKVKLKTANSKNLDKQELAISCEDEVKINTESQESNEISENPKEQENTDMTEDLVNENFKCLTCFELFKCKDTLRGHYHQKHEPPPQKIKEDDLYIKDDGKFKCKKCEKSFPKIGEMRRHALVKHAENRPFLCKICAKTFKDIPTIMRHARAHGVGERLACSFRCGYSTVYPSNLKDHETRLHKNDYKYKCDTCGKGFIVKSWYEEHRNIHTGAKPFICDICGIAYPLNKYLAHHRSMAHTHTSDLKRFNCLHCSHPCDSKNALKEHLSKEHGIKTSFLCNICGKTFNRYTIFKAHEAIHTTAKPHNCGLCKKSFKMQQHLRKHEQIHARAANFVCRKCVKGYSTEVGLNRHIARQHKA